MVSNKHECRQSYFVLSLSFLASPVCVVLWFVSPLRFFHAVNLLKRGNMTGTTKYSVHTGAQHPCRSSARKFQAAKMEGIDSITSVTCQKKQKTKTNPKQTNPEKNARVSGNLLKKSGSVGPMAGFLMMKTTEPSCFWEVEVEHYEEILELGIPNLMAATKIK